MGTKLTIVKKPIMRPRSYRVLVDAVRNRSGLSDYHRHSARRSGLALGVRAPRGRWGTRLLIDSQPNGAESSQLKGEFVRQRAKVKSGRASPRRSARSANSKAASPCCSPTLAPTSDPHATPHERARSIYLERDQRLDARARCHVGTPIGAAAARARTRAALPRCGPKRKCAGSRRGDDRSVLRLGPRLADVLAWTAEDQRRTA